MSVRKWIIGVHQGCGRPPPLFFLAEFNKVSKIWKKRLPCHNNIKGSYYGKLHVAAFQLAYDIQKWQLAVFQNTAELSLLFFCWLGGMIIIVTPEDLFSFEPNKPHCLEADLNKFSLEMEVISLLENDESVFFHSHATISVQIQLFIHPSKVLAGQFTCFCSQFFDSRRSPTAAVTKTFLHHGPLETAFSQASVNLWYFRSIIIKLNPLVLLYQHLLFVATKPAGL